MDWVRVGWVLATTMVLTNTLVLIALVPLCITLRFTIVSHELPLVFYFCRTNRSCNISAVPIDIIKGWAQSCSWLLVIPWNINYVVKWQQFFDLWGWKTVMVTINQTRCLTCKPSHVLQIVQSNFPNSFNTVNMSSTSSLSVYLIVVIFPLILYAPYSMFFSANSNKLSDEENHQLYGKCNNKAGHGHNYKG